MKNQVREAVRCSLKRLLAEDGMLFECKIEEETLYDARKLHEVCVNHRLANHLEREIGPILGMKDQMFVDLEFNREGINFKEVNIEQQKQTVRPDIIIHNRRTGSDKLNFLAVECKKESEPACDIAYDRQKIEALMQDQKYEYRFGLQVVYGKASVKGTLFFKSDTGIQSEPLDCEVAANVT